jgi:hypothetical protein
VVLFCCWWCCFKAKLSEILIRIIELISAHLPGNPFVLCTHTLLNQIQKWLHKPAVEKASNCTTL